MNLHLVRPREVDNRDHEGLLDIREEELAALRRGYARLEVIIRVQRAEIELLKAENKALRESDSDILMDPCVICDGPLYEVESVRTAKGLAHLDCAESRYPNDDSRDPGIPKR